MHAEKCPVCDGSAVVLVGDTATGKIAQYRCHGCHGNGWVHVHDKYEFQVSAGIPPRTEYRDARRPSNN